MKALKILGVILGIVVAGGGVAWATLIKAPSEADLCAHLSGLMDQKMPGFAASPAGAEFAASCPEKVKKGDSEGAIPYAKRAKCVMASSSMEAVDACD